MDCPICEGYGKTYASKPLGTLKQRYRKCGSCGYKFRTFEEIDTSSAMRAHTPIKVVPLVDAACIKCLNCNGDIRHVKRRETATKVVRYFRRKSCNENFAIETDLSDPIGVARAKKASSARVICLKCDGKMRSIGRYIGKSKVTRRQECQDCGHRFTIESSCTPREGDPPVIREAEIDHIVMP